MYQKLGLVFFYTKCVRSRNFKFIVTYVFRKLPKSLCRVQTYLPKRFVDLSPMRCSLKTWNFVRMNLVMFLDLFIINNNTTYYISTWSLAIVLFFGILT